MKSTWGSVSVKRDGKPVVSVSFNRGDEVAMRMVAVWFNMSYEDFLKLVPPGKEVARDIQKVAEPTMTNAIAGPSTATPRGVRR